MHGRTDRHLCLDTVSFARTATKVGVKKIRQQFRARGLKRGLVRAAGLRSLEPPKRFRQLSPPNFTKTPALPLNAAAPDAELVCKDQDQSSFPLFSCLHWQHNK